MDRDPQREDFIREKGAELEAAFRDAGTTLPSGVSGADLVAWALADMEKQAKSPEAQAVYLRMKRVLEEAIAELPGGIDDPDLLKRLEARSNELFGTPDASA